MYRWGREFCQFWRKSGNEWWLPTCQGRPGRLFICCTAREDAAAVDNERLIAPLAVTLRLGIRLSRHPLLFRLLSEWHRGLVSAAPVTQGPVDQNQLCCCWSCLSTTSRVGRPAVTNLQQLGRPVVSFVFAPLYLSQLVIICQPRFGKPRTGGLLKRLGRIRKCGMCPSQVPLPTC